MDNNRYQFSTIFLIDDDRAFRQTTQEILESHEYVVLTAGNADAALAMLENNGEIPDLILLDIQMPGMSGLQLLPKLRPMLPPECPILMLTANDKLQSCIQALNDGAADYILKEQGPQELLFKIKHFLNYVEKERQLRDLLRQMEAVVETAEEIQKKGNIPSIDSILEIVIQKIMAALDPVLVTGLVHTIDVGKWHLHWMNSKRETGLVKLENPYNPLRLENMSVFEDLDHIPLWQVFRKEVKHLKEGGIAAGVLIPIIFGGTQWGCIHVYLPEVPQLNEKLKQLLAIFAFQTGAILSHLHSAKKIETRSRMKGVSKFASGLAHTFRTSLAVLEHSIYQEVDVGKREPILRQIGYMKLVLKDMLELPRFESELALEQMKEKVDIHALVRRFGEEKLVQLEKSDIELDIKLPKSDPIVIMNRLWLERVLECVFQNAVEAILSRKGQGAKGTIRISTDIHPEFVELWVTDNGSGIDIENRESIFEWFKSSKEEKGTGVGLPFSKMIVESLGGSLELAENSDLITSFVFKLPGGNGV